jgi:hypothetical protein
MSGIAILKLQRAGFTDQQVEALAEYHEAGAATQSDILGLDRKLDAVRSDLEIRITDLDRKLDAVRSDLEIRITDLDRKLDATRSDLEIKLDAVRSDLENKISELDNKIDRTRSDLELAIERVRHDLELKIAEGKAETIRRVVGVGFAQVAMTLAVLRLFPSVHP